MTSKPRLLLHSCCAPCSSSVIERLCPDYNLTIFFYNPNIFPEEEYKKRLAEQKEYLKKLQIPIIEGDFCPQEFFDAIKNFASLPERSPRCYHCYEFRLKKTATLAKELGFDFFTTTLSVSPHKNAEWLNEIGEKLASPTTKFLASNFKKQNGYLRSLELSKQNNFYRQEYCGCEMSLRANKNKLEKTHKL